MPARTSKTPGKGPAASDEPVPMDPKAASRAIREHIEKKRSAAFEASRGAPEETVAGDPINNDLLLTLLQDTPRSLIEAWVRAQTGDSPETAIRSSKAEVEFLLLQGAAME